MNVVIRRKTGASVTLTHVTIIRETRRVYYFTSERKKLRQETQIQRVSVEGIEVELVQGQVSTPPRWVKG